MSVSSYLVQAGLMSVVASQQINLAEFVAEVTELQQQLQDFVQQQQPEVQWQYQVPELGEGGACSLFGQLAAEPYDLAATLGGNNPTNLAFLQRMQAVVNFYQQRSASDWFGIYQKRQMSADVLVKLAYFGAPSRAEFPITAEFAQISNNSSVAISGHARIIAEVASYVATGGEYYTCDPKVQAEACLPLFAANGDLIGIIDAEAFKPNLYTGSEFALLIAVVTVLPSLF